MADPAAQDYSLGDYLAAYKQVYGTYPANMTAGARAAIEGGQWAFNPMRGQSQSIQAPDGSTIPLYLLMQMAGQGGQQQQQAAPAAAASPKTNFGASSSADTASTGQQGQSYYGSQSMGAQDAFGIKQIGTGQGYAILQNAQGKNLAVDNAGNYFDIDAAGNHIPVSDMDAVKAGFQSANPETNALKQMGQIDPASEALRKSLGTSYADTLAQAQNPTAAQYQSYLDLFKQVDPEEYAQRQGMATSMDQFLKSQQAEYALGSQLDPVTQMQVEQQARKGQAARGNLYGSGQAAVEAMSTGQAGQALKQQRLTNLQQALSGQQSYLGAGLGLGDTAMNLYQQGLGNKAAAQQAGMGYLSSGQTPYQAGATYLAGAEGAAGNAAQGGPQYNPASLGTSYSGSAQSAPQYGLDIGSQSQNYFNSLNNAYGGAGGGATKNKTASALTGAASGAMSGATAGSAAGPYGTVIGGVVGAAAGGLGGYYS